MPDTLDGSVSPTCHPSRVGRAAVLTPRPPQWYGWRPDTPDQRDWVFAVRRGARLPAEVDLRETGHLPAIYDQGNLGSCTSNAWAGSYEYQQRVQGLTDYVPSRLFIYYGERVLEGSVGYDAGAEIRDGAKVLATLGAPHESLWAYDINKFAQKPPQPAYDDGVKHNCIEYRRVAVSETAVRYALSKNLPVVVGFAVYESFESDEVAKTGIVPIPGPDEQMVGGHAVLIVGYKKIGRRIYGIFRNSWGADWGDNGYFYMPLHYFCNTDVSDDYWVIQSVES